MYRELCLRIIYVTFHNHRQGGGAIAPPGTFHQSKTHQNRASLGKFIKGDQDQVNQPIFQERGLSFD